MNDNLHDRDEFFKKAYQQFEEEPSAEVWEKINAGLDIKGGEANRKRFIVWRRIAVCLLFLLAGLVLYNVGIFKSDPGHLTNRANDQKPATARPAVKSKEGGLGNKITEDETKKEYPQTAIVHKENSLAPNENDRGTVSKALNSSATNTSATINKNEKNQPKSSAFSEAFTNKNSAAKENIQLTKNENYELENIRGFQLVTKSSKANTVIGLPEYKKVFLSQVTNDTLIKNNSAINKTQQKKNSFVPFWMMAAYASYDRSNYQLDSDLPVNIAGIKYGEVHEPSFSIAILAIRQLRSHWGLQTGLIYSNTKIGISPQKLFAIQQSGGDIVFKYNTSSGYGYIKPGLGAPPAIGDSLYTTEGKHSLQFVRIPVMIKYGTTKNKFTVIPGAGIEANFLTSAKVETEIEHPVNPEIVFINKLDGARSFHFSVVAEAELRYQANKKLAVNLRPVFRYAISPITKNNVVETFPYGFGLGLGMTYKF